MARVLARRSVLRGLVGLGAALTLGVPLRALGATDLRVLLRVIDERQRSQEDYRAGVYMEQRERGKGAVSYEAQIYRRRNDDKVLVLLTAPTSVQGQAYLRVGESLWSFEPSTARWERRSERECIGETSSRCSDFESSQYALEFDPAKGSETKIGAYAAHMVALRAKPGARTAFPAVKLWIDRDSNNLLKRQDFALSGKLLRTAYYPRWRRKFSETKQAELWYPEEMRLYDELMPGKLTLVHVKAVDLGTLATDLFTKSWIESKSR